MTRACPGIRLAKTSSTAMCVAVYYSRLTGLQGIPGPSCVKIALTALGRVHDC